MSAHPRSRLTNQSKKTKSVPVLYLHSHSHHDHNQTDKFSTLMWTKVWNFPFSGARLLWDGVSFLELTVPPRLQVFSNKPKYVLSSQRSESSWYPLLRVVCAGYAGTTTGAQGTTCSAGMGFSCPVDKTLAIVGGWVRITVTMSLTYKQGIYV